MRVALTEAPAARSEAIAEWKSGWPLVLAGMLSMSLTVLWSYSLGVLLDPIRLETGWSRTQITSAQAFSTLLGSLLAPLSGMLVDRIGPRRLALPSIVVVCFAVMAFSLTSRSLASWYAVWCFLPFATLGLRLNVYFGAVATVFSRSRALALAMTICGFGIGSSVIPSVTNQLLQRFGWHGAYLGLGVIWLLLVFPPNFAYLRTSRDVQKGGLKRPAGSQATGVSVREGIRSTIFWRLTMAGTVFSVGLVAIQFHFVPILIDTGLSRTEAAGIAGLLGISAITGRLITGALLDRFPGSLVGGVALLLPTFPTALLLSVHVGPLQAAIIAFLFGFSFGTEMDILAYLSTRHFGLRNYGTLFGYLLIGLGIATAAAPTIASAIRDATGSYVLLFWLTLPIYLVSALAIATLPPYPEFPDPAGDA